MINSYYKDPSIKTSNTNVEEPKNKGAIRLVLMFLLYASAEAIANFVL